MTILISSSLLPMESGSSWCVVGDYTKLEYKPKPMKLAPKSCTSKSTSMVISYSRPLFKYELLAFRIIKCYSIITSCEKGRKWLSLLFEREEEVCTWIQYEGTNLNMDRESLLLFIILWQSLDHLLQVPCR